MNKMFMCLISCILLPAMLAGCSGTHSVPETTEVVSATGAQDNVQHPAESDTQDASGKLKVIFTVDVEDNRGDIPTLIEGDLSEYGIEENCGTNYIMDTFEKYDSKAVFFVNVYEAGNYDEEYMPGLLRRISERGHEVALHSHQNKFLDFYKKSLNKCTYDQQFQILKYGRDFIENATGIAPVSFRGGAYQCNDDTFSVLSDLGFQVDSSLYYGKFDKCTVDVDYRNQVLSIGSITEFPVEIVYADSGWEKLDIDVLTEDEIIKVIESAKESKDFHAIQLMFHSFTFMDLKGEDGEEPLYIDGNKNVYGEDRIDKEKLNHILEYLSQDDDIEIITFEDYIKLNLDIPEQVENSFFYIAEDSSLAFHIGNIKIDQISQNQISIDNTFIKQDDVLNYHYEILDFSSKTSTFSSGWQKESNLLLDFKDYSDDTYIIKARVRDSANNKSSMAVYNVTVEDGSISSIIPY